MQQTSPQEALAAEPSDSSISAATNTKGARFWFIVLSMNVALFVSALELTAVSNALPTIASDLHAEQFIWVGSAYALASAALIPMSGGLAEIFGRKFALLFCTALFFIGSAICGSAQNMATLIAGRTVQGLGSGGIQSVTQIILADLVSLEERGLYASIFGLVWSVANFLGPIVGGSLASAGSWRWLFYLNLPITGFSGASTLLFMNLPTPPGTYREKICRVDWIGNFLIIASTTACTIAITWGGITYSWTSARVLSPLVIGIVGLIIAIIYETKISSNPMIPWAVISNRTSVSGYVQTFVAGTVTLGIVYFIPVYLQSCKGVSPMQSGVIALGIASIAPAAAIASILVKCTLRYRPQMWFGWILAIIGLGLLSTIDVNTSISRVVGFLVFLGVGLGSVYSTTAFPVQAPLSVTLNAPSLALLIFCRAFSTVWGLTIGNSVLQNQLSHRLTSDENLSAFLSQFPQGIAIVYSVIPDIKTLPEPLKTDVQQAFSDSLQVLWEVLIGIAALGGIASFFMKGFSLHSQTDEKWAMDQKTNAVVSLTEMETQGNSTTSSRKV